MFLQPSYGFEEQRYLTGREGFVGGTNLSLITRR